MIVVCPKCGATNRIPDLAEPGKRYRCGKCETRLTHTSKAADAKDEGSVVLQPAAAEENKARVVGIAFLYLLGVAVAEAFVYFIDSTLGALCYAGILVAIIIHSRRVTEYRSRMFLFSLAIVPLYRIISVLAWRVASALDIQSDLAAGAFISSFLLVACVVLMRLAKFEPREVGLATGKPPSQLLIGLSGVIFGPALYYIAKPEPLIPELTWAQLIIGAFVLLIGAGAEELAFRGILQRTSTEAFGLLGLLYVSLLFALLHFGDVSGLNLSVIGIPFIFAVALFYSWVVRGTGSLLGVTLSHLITNIIFYLVAPLAF